MKSFFEKNSHRNDFLKFLKTKKIPLKFAYSGSAAITHDKLASEGTYHHAVTSELEQYKYIEDALTGKDINLIEIGPGNGTSSVDLINSFTKNGINITNYVGTDFSKTLMDICKNRIKKFFPKLPLLFYQLDIENKINNNTKKVFLESNKTNLVFMIGNTLGNVESPNKTLLNIAALLKKGDYFVIGVSLLKNDPNYDYVKDYLNEIFYNAAIEPFKMADIWNKADKFNVIFDKNIPAILCFYYPSKDIIIKKRNTGFTIKANSKIRCFMSRRFTMDTLSNLLKQSGFRVINNKISNNSDTCITTSIKE